MVKDQFGGIAIEDAPAPDAFGGTPVDESAPDSFGGIPVEEPSAAASPSSFTSSFAAAASAGALNSAAAVADVAQPIFTGLKSEPYDPKNKAKLDELNAQRAAIKAEKTNGKAAENDRITRYLSVQSQIDALKTGPANLQAPALLRDAARGSYEGYGADPASKNIGAQIGRGAGNFLAAIPAMMTALPAGIAQMAGQSYEQAYTEEEKAARAEGITDPAIIDQRARDTGAKEAIKQAPALAVYTIGGQAAAGVAGKLAGAGASALRKSVYGFAGAAVANVGAGAVLRALEAPEGQALEAAIPKVENLTGDTLFAVFHGIGEYRTASAEAKAKAKEELLRRKFDPKQISEKPPEATPPAADGSAEPPPGPPAPADEIIPTPDAKAAAEELARKEAETAAEAARVKAAEAEAAGLPETAAALRAKADEHVKSATAPEPPLGRDLPPPITPEIHRPEVELLDNLRSLKPDETKPPEAPPEGSPPPAPPDEFGGLPVESAPPGETTPGAVPAVKRTPRAPRGTPEEDRAAVLAAETEYLRRQSFTYVQPKRVQERPADDREEVVTIDIPAFDKAWSGAESEKGFYVGPGGEGAIKGRRERFTEWLKSNPGKPIETPEITIGKDGTPAFTNGRHRYSVLRDLGKGTMDVSMSPESAQRARELGYVADENAPKLHADEEAELRAEWEQMRKEAEAEAAGQFGEHVSKGGHELLGAVQRLGGLPSIESDPSFTGEVKRLWETNRGRMMRLTNKAQTLSLDGMREAMQQLGFHFDTPAEMIAAIETRLASGKEQFGFEGGGDLLYSKTPSDGRPKLPTPPDERLLDGKALFDAGRKYLADLKEYEKNLAEWQSKQPPLAADHVQKIGERIEEMKAGVSGVRVRVLRDEADLPDHVRSRLERGVIHEGVADTETGDIYIFAKNISSPERAAEVFAHEVVGHYGVEKIVPEEAWKGLTDSIHKMAPEAVAEISRKYEGRDTIAREYIARLAEKPALNPPLWRQVVQVVRGALRSLGIVRHWSEADIRDLIKRAGAAVADAGAGGGGRVGGTRAAVRDLGSEVAEHSPYAAHIEDAFHAAIPDHPGRAAVGDFVAKTLAGGKPADLPFAQRVVADRFLKYFRDKQEFADRNGVGDQAQDAYNQRLADNPNLTLPERLAVYSKEINKAVAEKTAATTAPDPEAVSGPTSIKNATVDAERAKRGLPPAMEPARRTFGRVWDEASGMVDRDPGIMERLVSELVDKPRPLADWEDALLLQRQIGLQNEQDRLGVEILKAADAGDSDLVDSLGERRDETTKKLLELYNVDKATGTALGRGLNARKMMANEDFSLAKMLANKRIANGAEPLTREQEAEVRATHAKIEELNAEAVKNDAAKSEAAVDSAFKAMTDEVEKEAPKQRKMNPEKEARVLAALRAKAEEAKARIKARRGRLNLGLDPADLLDHAIVSAEWLAKSAISIGRFGAKLVLEFGEYVRPHIPEIFAKAKELAATARSARDLPADRTAIVETMKERVADGDTLGDLAPFVRKLSLTLVRMGVTEREPLITAVHAELGKIEPDVTRRETMDLISGYGDFKGLDPEKAKATLRDLKGQMQQLGKLQDMAAGLAPKKTGVQRREPSDDERKLVKAVNEAKKLGGFEVTDPATQLRTALAAKERGLSNEIRDLSEEILSGERRPAPGESPTNPRIEALRALLENLRKTRDEIFGKKEMTDEQRLAASIAAADKATAEYERQVREEDFTRNEKRPKMTSPEYDAAVARRDAARAERDEFKALDEAVLRQKEEERTRELEDQISALDEKLKTGDIEVTPAKPPELTPAQEALVSERDAMIRLLQDLRKKPAAEAQVERILKDITELDRRLREGDLDPKKKSAVTPLSPEAARLLALRDERRRELIERRNAAKPKLTKEELALKRWKAATLRRIADLKDRAAAGRFDPPVRVPMVLDKEAQRISFEMDKAKEDFNRKRLEDMMRRRSAGMKILGGTAEVINCARAVMTSFDLSAVLRQGNFIVVSHPVRSLLAMPAMFRAFGSERGEHAVEAEIKTRPNALLYKQAKLELSERGTSLRKMEEAYRSRWARKIPGVAGSERAYTTFLNRLRADSFDAMMRSLSNKGAGTLEEAKAVANFINVATGRGDMGRFATAADALNYVFFAPRLVLSRMQMLVGQPLWGGTRATRTLIAGEYARYLIGAGLIIALAKAAGSHDVEDDPRSSSFFKLRFGNTRVDMFAGLIQSATLLSRVATHTTKNSKGELVSLRMKAGEKRKFGQDDTYTVLTRFMRTKFSPIIGSAIDISTGSDVIGRPITPAQSIGRIIVPLTFGDVKGAMEDQGVVAGTALALLAVFGAGIQTYEDKPKK